MAGYKERFNLLKQRNLGQQILDEENIKKNQEINRFELKKQQTSNIPIQELEKINSNGELNDIIIDRKSDKKVQDKLVDITAEQKINQLTGTDLIQRESDKKAFENLTKDIGNKKSESIENPQLTFKERFNKLKSESTIEPNLKTAKEFVGGVKEDISTRVRNIKDILEKESPEISKQTKAEDILQIGGQVAGGLTDIAGGAIMAGIKETGRRLSDLAPDIIEKPVIDITKDMGEKIIESDVGKLGIRAINKGVESYNIFKETYPRASRNLESIFNIGLLLYPAKPKPKIEKTALKKLSRESKILSKKITPKKALASTADDVKNLASTKYKEATAQGGILKTFKVNEIVDDIKKMEPQTRAGKIISGGEEESTKLIKRFEELKHNPLTLDELQEIDESLSTTMDKFIEQGRLNKEGYKIFQIQQKLREAVNSAGPNDIVNKEGFEALKEGRELWHRAAKLRDVENIIKRAELYDQPATAIKTGFRTLLGNKKRLRGYTPLEINAMKKASKTGVIGEVLRIAGSRLTPIITGATVGPVAGIGSFATTFAARKGGVALQSRRAKKALDVILKGDTNPSNLPFSNIVKDKLKSMGGTSLNNLSKTLSFIDDKIVKVNNANLINNLRLDRALVLEILNTLDTENKLSEGNE